MGKAGLKVDAAAAAAIAGAAVGMPTSMAAALPKLLGEDGTLTVEYERKASKDKLVVGITYDTKGIDAWVPHAVIVVKVNESYKSKARFSISSAEREKQAVIYSAIMFELHPDYCRIGTWRSKRLPTERMELVQAEEERLATRVKNQHRQCGPGKDGEQGPELRLQKAPGREAMALFESGLEQLRSLHAGPAAVRTQGLLDVCRLVLEVVDKLGTGIMQVMSDVGGNVDRLAAQAATNPGRYDSNVFTIVEDEVLAGKQSGSSSCTKGLLWLKRAMQFVTALLLRLAMDRAVTLSAAANEAYYATLKQYHSWLVIATYVIVLKLVPSRESFLEAVGADSEEEMQKMQAFCTDFNELLGFLHTFLESKGLDDPAKV
jgi:Glycolipid transfer protein (GLTP)